MLVNVIGMEVAANDERPLPAPKSSGNPLIDELRAQEIVAITATCQGTRPRPSCSGWKRLVP